MSPDKSFPCWKGMLNWQWKLRNLLRSGKIISVNNSRRSVKESILTRRNWMILSRNCGRFSKLTSGRVSMKNRSRNIKEFWKATLSMLLICRRSKSWPMDTSNHSSQLLRWPRFIKCSKKSCPEGDIRSRLKNMWCIGNTNWKSWSTIINLNRWINLDMSWQRCPI